MDTAPIPPQPDITEDDAPAMAGTLQNLLSEISDRVSLADRRYADIITEMQNKLSALDALAKATREQAEEEARQKEAEVETARKAKEEADRKATEAIERERAQAEAEAKRKAEEAKAAEEEASNLASAIDIAKKDAAAAFARHKASYPQDVDPFDIIDHTPTQPREPWDSVSADVFTRHFEESALSPDPAPSRQLTNYQPAHALNETGYGATISGHGEMANRTWLEGRFNDIATRITEMMETGGTGVGARFDSFENRLDQAMNTVTTQAITGSETLKQIEAHIVEIDEHVDFIRTELGRLDKVEEQIRALMERREETESEKAQSKAGTLETKEQAQAAATAGIAQLSSLLQRLMDERRHTEEHTVAMLDTLQQAMIRVLDRMDAIETPTLVSASKTGTEITGKEQPLEASDAASAPEPQHASGQDHHDDIEQALQSLIDQPETEEAPEQAIPESSLPTAHSTPEPEPVQATQANTAEAHTGGNVHHLPHHHHPHLAAVEEDDSFFIEAENAPYAQPGYQHGHTYNPAQAGQHPNQQTSISQIRRNFIADTRRAHPGEAEGRGPQNSQPPRAQRAAPPPRASLWQKLMRPSTKQLAIAAISLMVPLNAMFLYIIMAGPSEPQQPSTQTASQQMDMLANELTEASRADGSEPPIAQASDMMPEMEGLSRINPQGLAAQPIALTPTEDAQASEPAKLPPATIGPLSLREAAAKGDPSAQFEVAARFAEGKGIDQDFKSAVQWYLRSASHGFAQAQYRLGTHYERALGVDKDSERARIWYERAAAQGNVKAMHNLAVLASSGASGSTNYSEAVTWFTKAAEHNLPDSQFNLAVLLQNGLGVEADVKAAYTWFSLAARNGDKEAVRRREAVKSQLSAEAVKEADQNVGTFQPKPQIPVINDARVAGEQWKRTASSQD